MDVGHFYYLNDQYFIDFPDSQLMQNKETIKGIPLIFPDVLKIEKELLAHSTK